MPRRSKKKTFKKKSYRKKARIAKKVKTYVKKQIASQIQNKKTQRALGEIPFYNLIDPSAVYTLMPSITQGTGDADRAGNAIRIKKAVLRLMASSYAGFVAPFFVDMYVYKMKTGIVPPVLTQTVRFLESGNTATAYDGEPLDGLRPMNKFLFTEKLHIRKRMSSTTSGTAGTSISSTPPCFTMVKDITHMFKKRWIYDDNVNAPSNENVFISLGGSDMTGQVITPFGEYSFCVDFEYEDA